MSLVSIAADTPGAFKKLMVPFLNFALCECHVFFDFELERNFENFFESLT